MINLNLINRYEYLSSTIQNSYNLLTQKFNFKVLDNYFKNNIYAANVTKEKFGILFLDANSISFEIAPCRDQIIIKNNNDIPNISNPILVAIKYKNESLYKFYGSYEITRYTNKQIELSEYNPTYFNDSFNTKFIY